MEHSLSQGHRQNYKRIVGGRQNGWMYRWICKKHIYCCVLLCYCSTGVINNGSCTVNSSEVTTDLTALLLEVHRPAQEEGGDKNKTNCVFIHWTWSWLFQIQHTPLHQQINK